MYRSKKYDIIVVHVLVKIKLLLDRVSLISQPIHMKMEAEPASET
jgi:hypothetical protein